MKIEKKQVQHVAALARLKLSEAEQETFLSQIDSIIEFANKINRLHIDESDLATQSLDLFNVFRDDKQGISYDRDLMLANAPEQDDGWYVDAKSGMYFGCSQ